MIVVVGLIVVVVFLVCGDDDDSGCGVVTIQCQIMTLSNRMA